MRILAGLFASGLALAGCSSSSGGAPAPIDAGVDTGIDAGNDAGVDAGPPATFTQVYSTIISVKCAACHGTGSGITDGHLDMKTQASAYKSLVGTPTSGVECGGMGTRVVAGDSAGSILFQKVKPGVPAPCGAKMPLSGGPLTAAEAAVIASWIDGGAKND